MSNFAPIEPLVDVHVAFRGRFRNGPPRAYTKGCDLEAHAFAENKGKFDAPHYRRLGRLHREFPGRLRNLKVWVPMPPAGFGS